MLFRNAVRLVLLTAVTASAAGGEQFPTQQRGLSADTAYANGVSDHTNLYSGNLVATIGIGAAYPVGPSLSNGLALVYNSTAWDFEERQCIWDGQVWDYALPFPDPRANAGLWLLHLGKLYAPNHEPFNRTDDWQYLSADGGQHRLFDELHPGHPAAGSQPLTWFSRDGTYLRLRHFPSGTTECAPAPPNAITGSACMQLELQDGTVQEFYGFPVAQDSDWRLTRIGDRHGNFVDVRYPDANTWTLTDSHGRVQTITFSGGRVTQVDLTAFGGQTATYTFTYTPTVIARQRFLPPNCATEPDPITVDLLTRLTLPDDSFYEFTYYTSDRHPEYLSGGLKELRFPTGGKYRWTYQWIFFVPRDPPHPDLDWTRMSFGVKTKEIFEDNDDATPIGTWQHDYVTIGNPPLPPDEVVPCYHTVTVTDPLGNQTVNYFATTSALHDWTLGLPFTRCDPHAGGAELPEEGPFLSQEIYEGSVASGTKLRSVWVNYLSDGRDYGAVLGRNHRLTYRKVVYHDDGDRYREERYSGFDGLGKHRKAEVSGNYGGGGTRTAETLYHPQYGEYLIDPETMDEDPASTFVMPARDDPWVLTTYPEARISDAGGTAITQTCFDPATGFLERRRVLAGTTPADGDLLTVFVEEHNGDSETGRVAPELSYGGDNQGPMDNVYTDLCQMSLAGLDPQYRLDHTYSAGVLARSQWIDPCDDTAVVTVTDQDVDASTGLVATRRDVAGVATDFLYDAMGRLVSERPAGSAWTHYRYQLPTTSLPNQPLLLTIEQCSNGLAICEGSILLGWQRSYYDGLGRRVQEMVRYPGQTGIVEESRWVTYDALSRKTGESSWGSQSLWTTFSHDRFGRLVTIEPPGANPATHITYNGDRVVTRELKMATGAAGERTSAFTTELRDAFGRVEATCEGQETAWSGTCSAIETTYGYDEAGHVTHVCSGVDGPNCAQQRYFTYDNRGFLIGERQPEIGPSGNGWTFYSYDSLGNVLTRDLAGTTDFALRYTYDPASRLIRIGEVTGVDPGTGEEVTRPLKELYYARANAAGDLRKGKLYQAKRHNWVDVVSPLRVDGTLDAVITDTYEYAGSDGRISRHQTTYQLNRTTFAFRTEYDWDHQGNLSKIVYPRCLHSRCQGTDPYREVTYEYTRGFLTAVPGYTTTISYQLGGMLHKIRHSNGVTWEQTFNPADRLARPYEIRTTGVSTGNWSTGGYVYDGAANIQQIGTQRYQYDHLSRLLMGQVSVEGQNRTQTISYDDLGNITQLVTHGSSRLTPVNSTTNRITAASYDAGGNLTTITLSGETLHYTYDALNMMKYLQSNSGEARVFLYNADDQRIVAFDCPLDSCGLDTAAETWTLRDLSGELLRVYFRPDAEPWDWSRDYIHRRGFLLAAVEPETTGERKIDSHLDHLGTPR